MEIQIYCAHDEIVEVESLIENPRNPNKHPQKQLELLAKIIKNQGWRNPITVSKRSGFIVKGHGRLQAAKLAGLSVVPIDRQEYESEAAEWADMIADNRIAELAETDNALLKDVLLELDTGEFDMELAGFDEQSLEQLMAQFHTGEVEEDDFDAEEEAATIVEPVTKSGDMWRLGRHKLLCGDATDIAALERIMDGKKADLIFTDPPYNVDYGNHGHPSWGKHDKIANDKMSPQDWAEFVDSFVTSILVFAGGAIYICMSGKELPTMQAAFTRLGGHWSTNIIWNKDRFTLGRADYQRKYEPIMYGWVEGSGHYFIGERNLGDVWDIVRPAKSELHPTMKPVALVARAIQNSSPPGAIVADFFGGSGTTMVAAEQLGRNAYLCELAPVYCDVIIKRWETLTGGKAELIGGEDNG